MSAAPYPWLEKDWQRLVGYRQRERLPHALLVTGPAGIGKLELARNFVNYVLCRSPEANAPCSRCDACVQWRAGTYPDFREITLEEDDKGKLRQRIVVDQIRELSAEIGLTARQGGWKVALIQPADAMNVNAANSLLKTLEEPPKQSLLVLVTSRPAALPATIRSRCQQLAIPLPEPGVALEWLQQEQVQNAEAALAYAGNAPLRAQALAESGFLARRADYLKRVAAVHQRGASAVSVAAELEDEQTGFVVDFLDALTEDLVRLRQLPEEGARLHNPDLRKSLKTLAEGVDLAALHRYREAIAEARRLVNTPVNTRLLIESLLLPWATAMSGAASERTLDRLLEG